MSAPPWMPFYIRDYLADTQHLTTEQHGAYLLLLFACWSLGALPDNERELARIAKLSITKWRRFLSNFENFFAKNNDGLWHQKRLDRERQHIETIKAERSKAGSKGATKRWQTDNKGIARARVTQSQPQSQSKKEGERSEAKQKASNPKSKKPTSEPSTHAPARGNGADKEDFLDEDWKPLGRCAPLAAARPLRPAGALKARRKELLRQKLLRFVAARLPPNDVHAATLGLCAGDPEHSEQWWLDHLDILMRAEQWDDTEEFRAGENMPDKPGEAW